MAMLRAFVVLPFVVAFIPVVMIVCQALYVTIVYGFLLMGAALPRAADGEDGKAQ